MNAEDANRRAYCDKINKLIKQERLAITALREEFKSIRKREYTEEAYHNKRMEVIHKVAERCEEIKRLRDHRMGNDWIPTGDLFRRIGNAGLAVRSLSKMISVEAFRRSKLGIFHEEYPSTCMHQLKK